MRRNIEEIMSPPAPHWVGNGFHVRQYFPRRRLPTFFDRISPFILLDYNAQTHFKGTNSRVGVGPHPHRGFETVTFAFEGKVAHGDNQGNSGVIGPGDIQWMTAGSGILHKEYQEEEYAKNDRTFHMIQLWVNLPAKYEMTDPKYQAITEDQLGLYEFDNGYARVYAGELLGTKGPAKTFSPMNIYKLTLNKGAKIALNEPSDFNLGLLVIDGKVKICDEELNQGEFALMKNEEGSFDVEGLVEGAQVFVISGQPLREPVIAGGPFVLSNEKALMQAYEDYHTGGFGSLDF